MTSRVRVRKSGVCPSMVGMLLRLTVRSNVKPKCGNKSS